MTALRTDQRPRRLENDPRVPWAVSVTLVAAIALVALHPLFSLAVPVCGYLLGRVRTPGWPLAVALALTVALSPLLLDTTYRDARVWAGTAAAGVLLGLSPWLVGRYRLHRAELSRAEAELMRNVEHSQWEMTVRTRLRERARIAQEMHDTLGHQLSLIALRAGALEVGIGLESQAVSQKAAEQLRAATTRAAEQLGDIVGVLADPAEATPRRPGPDQLEPLVRQAAEAGMDVKVDGSQGDLDALSPLAARTALRVIQEGLTNAAKHAPGAAVVVKIDRKPDEVIVRVVDSGSADGQWSAGIGGGRGLVGLTDRVEYLGGRVEVEQCDAGFALTAHLPTRSSQRPAEDQRTPLPSGHQAGMSADTRRAHRSLAWITLIPLTLLTVIGILLGSYFVYVTVASVLTQEEFEQIQVGDSHEAADSLLPPVEMLEPPDDRLPAPEDPAATCAYYEGEVSFFERAEVYRICFSDGLVTSTDTIAPETP